MGQYLLKFGTCDYSLSMATKSMRYKWGEILSEEDVIEWSKHFLDQQLNQLKRLTKNI